MASILVTPLLPPFKQDVMTFEFAAQNKKLTVSLADGERIKALFGDKMVGRDLVLEYADQDHIRIYVSQ